MFLYLKRSERFTWLGTRRYILTAHIETNPEELRVVQAHRFSENIAWMVPLAHVTELENRAEFAYQRQKRLSVFNQEDTGKILWENAKVVGLAIRAAYAKHMAFRVTANDLIAGTVVEATSLLELLQTEASIQKFFDALQRLVHHAASFEQNSESIFSPAGEDEDQIVPPSTWPRYSRT